MAEKKRACSKDAHIKDIEKEREKLLDHMRKNIKPQLLKEIELFSKLAELPQQQVKIITTSNGTVSCLTKTK